MGFFSKLFGSKGEEKPIIADDLPVCKASLKGICQLKLTEVLQPAYSTTLNTRIQNRREALNGLRYDGVSDDALVDQMKVQYQFDLDYVVFDEKLLQENIGDVDPAEDLNELFYVSLTEFNSITVKVIEGDAEDYANAVLGQFNEACKDWGIKGKHLSVQSIAPTSEYLEFYEAYKKVWG